jgi:hypothetical protein
VATVTQYILDTKKLYLDLMKETCDGVDVEWGEEFDRITDQKISESDFVKTFNVDPADVLCFPEDAPVNIFNKIYESGKYNEYWHEGKVVTIKEPTVSYFIHVGNLYYTNEVTLVDRLVWLMDSCRHCMRAVYSQAAYESSVWVVEENGVKTILPLDKGYPPCYLWGDRDFPVDYPQFSICDDIEWD